MAICQRKFTQDLLQDFLSHNATSMVSPLDLNHKLFLDQGVLLNDPSTYGQLVEKLNFLIHTRPDISFSVQNLSQFMACPRQPHRDAAVHVLRYLKANPAQGLFYNTAPSF